MLFFILRALAWLPLPVLHAMGVAAGWLVYGLSPSYRRMLKANLVQADYLHFLRSTIGEAGKGLMELAFVWYASLRRISKKAKFKNWELVQSCIDRGQGIIFLTPHLGCFEMAAQLLALRVPLTVLYRPPRKPWLESLLEQSRQRSGMRLAAANLQGVRILLKTLKKKGVIGLLPDQVPQKGEGQWLNFFGKKAYTMTLPAKLQQVTGASVLLVYAQRLSWGRGYVICFEPFEIEADTSVVQQTEAVNAAMERLIAKFPAQYFWSYNRYKTPAGVASDALSKNRTAIQRKIE